MTAQNPLCPCCGHPIFDATALDPVIASLRPMARRIVEAIRDNPGISTADVIKAAYRRRRTPFDPANSIRVAISDARPTLQAAGWVIVGSRSHGYRLERAGGQG